MGLFKKVKKKLKKVARGVGNIAQAAAPFVGMVPGVGTVAAAALGAGGSLLSGDSLRTAIGSGIAGGLGGLAGGALGSFGNAGGLLGGILGGGTMGGYGGPQDGSTTSNGMFGWSDALFGGSPIPGASGGGIGGASSGGILGALGGLFGNGSGGTPSNLGAFSSLLGLGADVFGNINSGNAARDASRTQAAAASAAIQAQNAALADSRNLLNPYINAGAGAIGQQGNLVGINGASAQQAAIDALQASPQFTSLLQQGNNSILQNASATGGLRGGNVQAALAQFSPALLAQTINDQYSRLGGIAGLGYGAAAQQGQFGLGTASNIGELLSQRGQATAGGQIARGNNRNDLINSIGQGLGSFAANGGFRGLFS